MLHNRLGVTYTALSSKLLKAFYERALLWRITASRLGIAAAEAAPVVNHARVEPDDAPDELCRRRLHETAGRTRRESQTGIQTPTGSKPRRT
ncbi:hypothetical protein MRX96_016863 [Rhipicephalus microplus]